MISIVLMLGAASSARAPFVKATAARAPTRRRRAGMPDNLSWLCLRGKSCRCLVGVPKELASRLRQMPVLTGKSRGGAAVELFGHVLDHFLASIVQPLQLSSPMPLQSIGSKQW